MTTTFNIADLMDGLGDDALELADAGFTTPDRILALVRERSGMATAYPKHEARRGPRKLARVLLIAAALTLLLSVTVYAAYQLTVSSFIINQPAYYDTEGTLADTRSRISAVGYHGTPEYMAYTEWETYLRENPVDWDELDLPNGYAETDRAHLMYNAWLTEQAEALDQIVEKYGLTLHSAIAGYERLNELYGILGTEPFYTALVPGSASGYVFDDGSFKTEGDFIFPDGRGVSFQLYAGAKGSFSMISDSLDLSEGYEEWSYETEGAAVDLILTPEDAQILAEVDGAYISVNLLAYGVSDQWQDHIRADANQPVDKARLEAIAGSIDFAVLARYYDGTAHPDTAQKVAALEAEMLSKEIDPDTLPVPEESEAELGLFGLADVPEGYTTGYIGSQYWKNGAEGWTEQGDYDMAEQIYQLQNFNGFIRLNWYRFQGEGGNAKAFADGQAYFLPEGHPLTDINGCDGFVTLVGSSGQVMWLDEGQDLLFLLETYNAPLDVDALADLARSVVEQDPADPPQIITDPNIPPTPPPQTAE